jgi:hypothetical protein
MADEKLVKLLKESPENFNQWRKVNPTAEIDLRNLDFSDVNLIDSNLSWGLLFN